MLDNKIIAITGGSKGLGFNCVQNLLEQNARVFVLSRSQGQLAPLLTRYPKQLVWLQTDMADASTISSAFNRINGQTQKLDALILNAALTTPKYLADFSADEIQNNLMINIAGPLLCMQQAAPLLKQGRMIFISSESVETPFPMLSLYASVKMAVETLFNGLREEMFKANQIKLSILRAGSMADTAFGESWSQETLESFYTAAAESGNLANSGTPMPTQCVTDAILFLLRLPDTANVNKMDLRSADGL